MVIVVVLAVSCGKIKGFLRPGRANIATQAVLAMWHVF